MPFRLQAWRCAPPTLGAGLCTWDLNSGTGGLPQAGAPFSLTLTGGPSCTPRVLAISAARLQPGVPVGGMLLHVDVSPTALILLELLPCAQSFTLFVPPLPLALGGLEFYMQGAQLDPLGLAASRGLMLTIL